MVHASHTYSDYGDWAIVQGLAINDFSRGKMNDTETELAEERDAVRDLLPP